MPVILFIVIIFVIWLHYESSKTAKIDQKARDVFWEKEATANTTRKVDISNLDYITIPMDTLPFQDTTDENLLEIQNTITKLSKQKILNLTGLSNTDLKLTYGVANLSILSDYDQNYTQLVRTLNKWATYLYDHNEATNAKTVLEYAITCHSDISSTYLLLAKIYIEEDQPSHIHDLIKEAEGLHSLTKDHIIQSLNDMI